MSYDIHMDREATPEQVAECLGAVFGVRPSEITVVDSYDNLPRSHGAGLTCVYRRRSGEFPLSLELLTGEAAGQTEAGVAKVIAQRLACRCVISDDSPDPFSWALITPDGMVRRVSVDPDALSRGEFLIRGAAGHHVRPETPLALALTLTESAGLFGRVGAPVLFCWLSAAHLPGGPVDDGQAVVVSRDVTGAWREHSRRVSAERSLEVLARLRGLGLPERAPEVEGVTDTSAGWSHISFEACLGERHTRLDISMHSSGFEGRDAERLRELFRYVFSLAGYSGYESAIYGDA